MRRVGLGVGVSALLIASSVAAQPTDPSSGEADSRSRCVDVSAPMFRGDLPGLVGWSKARVVQGAAAQDVDAWSRSERPLVVRGASLAGRSFQGADLGGICFEDGRFAGADFTGAKLDHTAFVRSDLSGAKLAGRLVRTVFVSTALTTAAAQDAEWVEAEIVGGLTAGLDLRRARLRDLIVTCAADAGVHGDHCLDQDDPEKVGPVDARGADLTGAAFDMWRGGWRLEGARIDRVKLDLSNAPDLKGADLAGPVYVAAEYADGGRIELSPAEWRMSEAAWRDPAANPAREPRGPSFDCAVARTPVERLICEADDFGALATQDRHFAELHAKARKLDLATAEEQAAWWKRRDACRTAKCLRKVFGTRGDELLRRIATRFVPPAGQEAIYVSHPPPFEPAFQETELYARLAPAVAGGWGNVLYVRGLGGDRIYAAGEGSWFNFHTCGLEAGPYRFEPKTGWFVGPEPTDDQPVLRILETTADVSAIGEHAHATCGARGSWHDPLTCIPIRPADLDRLRVALTGEPQTSPMADR